MSLLAQVASEKRSISVVVGYSNTIPNLIRKPGGPKVRELSEDEFGHFYILTRHENHTSLLALRY